jgi:drug/metabolite transporter (DMT)-like permease
MSLWETEAKIIALDLPLQLLLKQYSQDRESWKLYSGASIGAAQYVLWAKGAIGEGGLAKSNVLWDALSSTLSLALGPLVFNERLDSTEWLAMALMASGIVILARHDFNK